MASRSASSSSGYASPVVAGGLSLAGVRRSAERVRGRRVGDRPLPKAGGRDWSEWHAGYDRDSAQRRRLQVVQARIRDVLASQARGAIQVINPCSGQGRNLLPVIAEHPRRADIRARLVELDPRNVKIATTAAARLGLSDVEVVEGDASLTACLEGVAPAHVILACGVFGNISNEDIVHTIEQLPTLCAPAATVIWTRGRRPPDLRAAVRGWFTERGFEELSFQGEPEPFGVGVHRLVGKPRPFDPSLKLFTFGTRTPA
jgi:Putative methyltransferase